MITARFLLLCVLAWGQAAFGHAVLTGSDPAIGAALTQAPEVIVLNFNEPVGITRLALLSPDGQSVPVGPAQAADSQVRIPLPALDAQGTYLLSWRASSADGHPVGGTVDFTVGAAAAGAPAAAALADASPGLDFAIWLGRLLALICLVAACGAAFFRATAPALRQDWVGRVIGIGLGALFLNLALQGLDLLGAPWGALIQDETWRTALASPYAGTLGFSALALAASFRAQDTDRRLVLRLAAAGSLILLGIAVANSGHAGTAPPQWLSQPTIALHVIAAAAWLGALVPLIRILRDRSRKTIPGSSEGLEASDNTLPASDPGLSALARFSRWITPMVALLILSGGILSWLQLDHISDFWRTQYGWVLSAKLGLVLVLLAVAAWNRWRLTRPVLAGDPTATRHLTRAIQAEIVLGVLILSVVSLWRFTPPPRSLDAAPAASAVAGSSAGAGAHLINSPLVLGNSQVSARIQEGTDARRWTIHLETPGGAPFAAQAVTINLYNPEADIEAVRREASADGNIWQVSVPSLPNVGHWYLRLDVLVDDFNRLILQAPLAGTPAD